MFVSCISCVSVAECAACSVVQNQRTNKDGVGLARVSLGERGWSDAPRTDIQLHHKKKPPQNTVTKATTTRGSVYIYNDAAFAFIVYLQLGSLINWKVLSGEIHR